MNNARLSRIELFAFNTRPSFLSGSESSGCWYGVLKLTCGRQISYGECILCADDNAVDLIKWGSFLKNVRNCTVEEALEITRLHGQEWAPSQWTLLQAALDSMLQTRYLRAKTAAGTGRNGLRGNAYSSSADSLPHDIKYAQGHLSPAQLFGESVSYFSLV